MFLFIEVMQMVDLMLKKAFKSGKHVQIIYMDQKQRITQRWIKIIHLDENQVEAYCYLRKAPRRFERSQILAAS
jgi:predicted DNA-binding transcriptional regulator YafY